MVGGSRSGDGLTDSGGPADGAEEDDGEGSGSGSGASSLHPARRQPSNTADAVSARKAPLSDTEENPKIDRPLTERQTGQDPAT